MTKVLMLVGALLTACGNDASTPDAATGGTFTIAPDALAVAPGQTVTATVRLDREVQGEALAFVILGEAADVFVSDGTIAAGASSADITLAATPTAAVGTFTITARSFAAPDIVPGTARVTVN